MYDKRIEGSCTAREVFAALRKQVVECAARMNQQGLDRVLPTRESHEPETRRIEIRRKTWVGTVLARVRFELGGQHITVKEVGADDVSACIAFQVFPRWDDQAKTCRLPVYGNDDTLDALEDPDLEAIIELALKRLQ